MSITTPQRLNTTYAADNYFWCNLRHLQRTNTKDKSINFELYAKIFCLFKISGGEADCLGGKLSIQGGKLLLCPHLDETLQRYCIQRYTNIDTSTKKVMNSRNGAAKNDETR